MSTSIYESGDGVPNNVIDTRGDRGATPTSKKPPVTVRGATIAFGVFGQVCLAVVVALGGDPLIGAVASVAMLVCSLILAIAEAVRRVR